MTSASDLKFRFLGPDQQWFVAHAPGHESANVTAFETLMGECNHSQTVANQFRALAELPRPQRDGEIAAMLGKWNDYYRLNERFDAARTASEYDFEREMLEEAENALGHLMAQLMDMVIARFEAGT